MGATRSAVLLVLPAVAAACGGGHGHASGTTTTTSSTTIGSSVATAPGTGASVTSPLGTVPASSSTTSSSTTSTTGHSTTTIGGGGTTTTTHAVTTTTNPVTTTTHGTTTSTTVATTTTTGGGTTQSCVAKMTNPGPIPGGTDTVSIASNVPSSSDTIVVHYSSGPQTYHDSTNPSGADNYTFNIGHPPAGQPVPVSVTVQSASCTTSFTPQ